MRVVRELTLVVSAAAVLLHPVALHGQQVATSDTARFESEGPPVSPRGAFLRSLVLPGWGQAYVGAEGRGALYFTLSTGSMWMAYLARRQLEDARQEQDALRAAGLLPVDEESPFVEARAQHFEDWAALSIFLMFFSGADAYVAAYLSDFEERIGARPAPDGSLRLEVQVPLGSLP